MKNFLTFLTLLMLVSLTLSACAKSQSDTVSISTSPPVLSSDTAIPPSPTLTELPPPTETPIPAPTETSPPPNPTPFTTSGWSTSASTRTELSFAFPGEWDGSSRLTFGEGEFVKDPDQPLGVTFQIELSGDPVELLSDWGTKDIGVIGIVTFAPESVMEGDNVTIARVDTPTKIAQGNGITAQVAYIQRAEDVIEIMWFAPSEQWESLQTVFQGVRENIEIWRLYPNMQFGLQTMYVHDWQAPQAIEEDTGLWFRSADESTGLVLYLHNEIADPVQRLEAWSLDRLESIGLSDCTLVKGDRMDTLSGQWESKTGECSNAAGGKTTYEVTFVPNKDRLIEIITFAPTETWEQANAIAFKHLLGMMVDIRP